MRSLALLLGALALGLCACSGASSSGGSSATSGSSDLGSGASGTTSCVFEQRTLTSCVGAGSSQSGWSPTCLNEACEVASLGANSLVEDGCSASTVYQNINDFKGTCDDWAAAGSPLGGLSPSGDVCGTPPYSVSSTCQSCIDNQCCSETAACQAGTPCASYLACLDACTLNDTACGNACGAASTSGYSAAAAWFDCVYNESPTSCLSECGGAADAGVLE